MSQPAGWLQRLLATNVPSPDGDDETFILCRSRDRTQKDLAIVRRFEQRIEQRLTKMAERCEQQQRDPRKVERDVGRLLGQNTRAARLFDVNVETTNEGHPRLSWQKCDQTREWAKRNAKMKAGRCHQ